MIELYIGGYKFQEDTFALTDRLPKEDFILFTDRRQEQVNKEIAQLFLMYARQIGYMVPVWVEVTFSSRMNNVSGS